MTTRIVLRMMSVFACVAVMALPAVAGDNEGAGGGGNNGNGVCTLDGAWLGYSPAWGLQWTAVYDSDSHWTGPISLQFIGGDPSFGGQLPSTFYSSTTGTWVRTGRRTFEYTMITYGLGVDSTTGLTYPVYIGKNTGTVELSGHCDFMDAQSLTVELFDPTQDPFGDDPPTYGCTADGSMSTAHRMTVDPPCEPPPP